MPDFAAAFYRQAAKLSAGILAASPTVESVLLHRSAATGEISFGRSDIDMLLMVDAERASDGGNVASLYNTVRRAQLVNPALNHIEVHDQDSLETYSRLDTFWASSERRSLVLLRGRPVAIPCVPVHPDHSLGKFLGWLEWFFAISVQQRNARNLWKTSLESWNAYATAEGLIDQPCLRRSEMEAAARRIERGLLTDRLREPAYAAQFVFELADRLHCARLPALRKLTRPLVFEAITAPLCLRRRFVVLPYAGSALPPEAFTPGAFPCTPEVLDLFLRAKNSFFHWALPPELYDLGVQPPAIPDLLRSCLYYVHRRFLFVPGFGDRGPVTQAARMALIRHAVDSASRGELPPAVPQDRLENLMAEARARSIPDYYRTDYEPLLRQSLELQSSLHALLHTSSQPKA